MNAPTRSFRRAAKRMRSMSHATTILAGSLVLALIPMLIMALQGYHCGSQAVTESITDDLKNSSDARAARLTDWIERQKKELDYLARVACLPPECQVDCSCQGISKPSRKACQLMETFRNSLDGFAGMAVLDADRTVRGSLGQFPSPPESLSETRVTALMARENGEPLLWQVELEPLHYLAGVRLVDGEKRASGLLLAHLDLTAQLRQILERPTGLGDSGRGFIAHPDGTLISLPREGRNITSQAAPRELRDLMEHAERGGGVWQHPQGSMVVGGFARIAETDLALVIERDYKDALAWLPRLARRALIVGLLTAVAVFLFSRGLARRLNLPLGVLASVAKRISSGDHVARVPKMVGRELMAVRVALNDMLDALYRSRRQLSQSAALAAVGELSTSIAHEMRNPLSSVKMNLQAVARKVADDEVHSELADIATRQVARIERMLGDLLDYSKPLSIIPRQAPVKDVLESVLNSVDGFARERGVTLVEEWATSLDYVYTDPERLAQALENLVRNAIEASSRNSEVTLHMESRGQAPGGHLFEVRDRGTGLPSGNRQRLFRPFFTSKAEGTGLGLANVKKIIELLGGSVEAFDRDGGGAVFRVTIPTAPGLAGDLEPT